MNYKTELRGTRNGKRTYGAAFVLACDGQKWLLIGHTHNFKTYPQLVRARAAAEGICRRYHKAHFPQLPISLHRH